MKIISSKMVYQGRIFRLDKAVSMVYSGRINDAKTIAGVMLLKDIYADKKLRGRLLGI